MSTIRTTLTISSILLSFSVVSCNSAPSSPDTGLPASSADSSQVMTVPSTQNVNYTGTIEKLGVSIYQQGTHKLVLDDGRFIVLAAADSSLNLGAYEGKRVEVSGSVQPTVEAGGTIMSVGQVTLLGEVSSSQSSAVTADAKVLCGGFANLPCPAGQTCVDDTSDSCDPAKGGADCSGVCVSSSASSKAVVSSVAASVAVASSKPVQVFSSSKVAVSSSIASAASSAVTSTDIENQIALMAKQNYASTLWTQKYCTTLIGFCVPAHKQWYFISLGTKSGTLWHVEFSTQDISGGGNGPIVLNLVSGLSASKGQTDGAVAAQGNQVVGYKDWTNNRHFEITADARLSAAVSYMVSHMETYEFSQ